jgi:hypothetical protein
MPRLSPLDRLRKICFALPEAMEKTAWSAPTFAARLLPMNLQFKSVMPAIF